MALLPLAALVDAFASITMVVFMIVTIVLTLVILLQEGKGGGLAGAFGGAGAQVVGVKAGTVNKFTAWLGAIFLGLALLHAGLQTVAGQSDIQAGTNNAAGGYDDVGTEDAAGAGAADEDASGEGLGEAGSSSEGSGDAGSSDEGGAPPAGDGSGDDAGGSDG